MAGEAERDLERLRDLSFLSSERERSLKRNKLRNGQHMTHAEWLSPLTHRDRDFSFDFSEVRLVRLALLSLFLMEALLPLRSRLRERDFSE